MLPSYPKSVRGLREIATDLEHDAFLDTLERGLPQMARAFKLRYLANALEQEYFYFVPMADLIEEIGDDIGPTLQLIIEETFYGVSVDITASEFAKLLRAYVA